jgi:hypothetical protein
MKATKAPALLFGTALLLAGCGHLPSGGLQDAADALRRDDAPAAPPVVLADAAAPARRVGDTFVFGRSSLRRVVAVSGGQIEWATSDDRRYLSSRHFFAPVLAIDTPGEQRRSTLRGDPGALWPLRVGRSVEFDELRTTRHLALGLERRSTLRWRCTVPETRHVSVPAGDFDSFHVRCEAHRADLPVRLPLQIVAWDYAPTLGHYVRRQWYEAGRLRESVLGAALPARVATPERVAALLERLQQMP